MMESKREAEREMLNKAEKREGIGQWKDTREYGGKEDEENLQKRNKERERTEQKETEGGEG
jgi:hypothetical protein